ncbi:hypothetical protein JCM19239_2510 [Vibrio variabilis]|uniref:Uncharacterized protein n=1 Tax=Vibrio variabilis TaxID=990271 RepID=A0ABQ0JFN2_9VIBR|nr:hypothetical protein JCM19239_2510 [Vibrio variabilis]
MMNDKSDHEQIVNSYEDANHKNIKIYQTRNQIDVEPY